MMERMYFLKKRGIESDGGYIFRKKEVQKKMERIKNQENQVQKIMKRFKNHEK